MQSSTSPLTGPIPVPETAEDALMSLMMALGRRLRQRQPGDEIDFSAFPILKLLSHQGPMRVSSLAQVLGLDASTVSRHAKQLEDRGLIERTDDPDDRRASRVAVSSYGSQCLAQAFATRHGLLTHALADWTDDERATLRTLLHRVITQLLLQHDQQDQHETAPLSQENPS